MKKKNVALVLSSGGARGLAHIGVIEGLLKEGFTITSIAGSSMGALVGAYHAAGQLQKYKEWASNLDKIDLFKLFDFTFSTQGFIKGERVFKTLETFIPDMNIEDLSIPYAAIATDAKNQEEVIFTQGSMYEAIRASASIPTVLKPVIMGDKELIDGGVLNPLPIDKVVRTKGDILVVVNVNSSNGYMPPIPSPTDKSSYSQLMNNFLDRWGKLLPGQGAVEKKLGFFDILNRSIEMMQEKISESAIQNHKPDIMVNISKEACSTFEFYKAKELITAGETAFYEVYNSPKANS